MATETDRDRNGKLRLTDTENGKLIQIKIEDGHSDRDRPKQIMGK